MLEEDLKTEILNETSDELQKEEESQQDSTTTQEVKEQEQSHEHRHEKKHHKKHEQANIELDPLAEYEKKLNESEMIAKDYLDKLQRTMAEYDNFRKRTIKEKSQMYENGAKEVVEKFLPVMDNFERALVSVDDESKETAFVQGIELIYKQLLGTMKELGVEEIDALNKPFDPNLHHAVAHEENEAYGENEVVDILQKGYMFKDRVLRFSMVKVAN